jgi:hypothetical protein
VNRQFDEELGRPDGGLVLAQVELNAAELPERPAQAISALTEIIASAHLGHGVFLLALTGSSVDGRYQPGWSDIDVVLVVDSPLLDKFVDAVKQFGATWPDTSTALLSTSELRSGRVPPKVDYVLRQLNSGSIKAQYRRHAGDLPVLTDNERRLAADFEMNIVLERCRRYLLTDPLRERAVYKYCTLLARLMLRSEIGADPSREEDVLATFHDIFHVEHLSRLATSGHALSADDLRSAALHLTEWIGERPAHEHSNV